jgi:hypothetical protein
MQVVPFARSYPSRYGAPVLTQVDTAIFTHSYFTHCMQCSYCGDWCCSHGVDVDEPNVARILARAVELEAFTGVGRERWFEDELGTDPEFPSGAHRRTAVADGGCVFLDRRARGCMLHAFCLARGLDYHELKPMVSALFPVTFADGVLLASDEVDDGTLVCLGEGPSLYQGARDELRFYFGEALVAELDGIERSIPTPEPPVAGGRRLAVLP